ncbi:AAA family ATPase [Nostoc sp. TCL26-01]|uniref:AAA family ATPase n=1 Tax=Nostoc sp. TCL26-01 TaxID=2576904 RepID=UPI0015BD7896|nr:AAA family ATPase [Nostoc sp. TCL26-01]QLE57950.1 PAS domain S-box protein [Nostoc sp. TCL26-01]
MISLPNVAIQGKIYESSNSLVYRGTRTQDNLAIILKVLKQDYPAPSEIVRYKQEYEMTRSLNLEGIIKAYAQQEYQRTLVILLEDFGGESLELWMHQQPEIFCPMPLSAFLKLAIDLTDILGRIHAAGVIHKDINPNNIVLNSHTGVVKIIDFGIATQFNRTSPTFKSPHVLEGTLAYLSPEQTGRMNRAMDYRTDFYSLGVTFYQLLTGQLPFPTTDVLELVHCHIAKLPTPPHELSRTIPQPVSDIILKLMAKNAEDRYQSAWGIKADLEQCAEQLAASGQINHIQLGLQDVSDRFQIPQKLYGREAEIAILLAVFERVAGKRDDTESDNTPASSEMLLVSGYSGIGKSALVQELYKPITAKRGYFISGKFDQLQRNIPYSAIVDALRKLVQQLLGEPDEQMQQWRSRLLTALGSNGQLIINVIPEVELIIGKQPPVTEVGATEAQNRFNLVFGQFIRVFCSKEHPLVIFLDDLQWIDSATLKLIELMMLDEQTQGLFLIGAYRDNEVSPTHPLVLTLEGLQKQGAVLHQIVLSPLTLEPLSKLIAEALYRDTHTVLPLAELVLRKTGGNPFLVCEFLRLLYSENLLRFDADHLSWRWNFDQIRDFNITDDVNVVDLLLNKLKKLPEVTRQLLQLAACIGAEFDLGTLAIVYEQSPKTVFQNLLTAILDGLIQPLSELDEDLLVQDYKFLHDCVQQAAYTLIDPSQKQTVHLQIGRNLLEKTLPEQFTDQLFAIVDHLNYGIELVTDRAEREEIARLNLLAGQRAKAAIAYSAALAYLATGIKLLAIDSWGCQYPLTLALHEEITEAAYLSGDFDEMKRWETVVLQQAKTVLDKVKVYQVRLQTYISQNKRLEAIKIALQILEQLGISLPEAPTQLDIQQKLAQTKAALANRSAELADLPIMTDANKLAAMQILSSITASTYIAAPDLFLLTVLEQVLLSIQYGNAQASTFAYASYGIILNAVFQSTEEAYQFGLLAKNLVEKLKANSFKSKTFHVIAYCLIYRKYHIRESISLFDKAYSSGIENGDLEFAGFAIFKRCQHSYWSGFQLIELSNEFRICSHTLAQIKQKGILKHNQIFQQMILNLVSVPQDPCYLSGDAYNEEELLCHPIESIDKVELLYFYFNKFTLNYLFENYHQAIDYATLSEQYLDCIPSSVTASIFHFYDSLSRLAIYSHLPNSEQESLLLKVNSNQAKVQTLAVHAPMNFQHKYNLVEAEIARIQGNILEAEEFYEQAIQGAKNNEYLQEEALAYELAAKFYLSRGREKFARTYMKEAHCCYERWGATTKVKDLETRYSQFFSQSSDTTNIASHKTSTTTSNSSPIAFDLVAVLRASQAISSEIEFDQLLRSLMQILIENAGAQTGCLLLETLGEWMIEAACELNDATNACVTRVLQSLPMTDQLPESIIQYVIRTHESVILNDATREGNFINEPYIQRNQTQSLLCLPLLKQSQLVGVLYLENRLATGVFTPARSELLHLLSTQAAIAIENAKLYAKLRASESQMSQFLEAIPVGIGIIDGTGRPYYVNQRGIELMGKGVDPAATPEQLAEIYQFYVTGTDQIYPTQRMPIIRALSGERTRIDDADIRQNDINIPCAVWGTPVFDEQGNVVYAIAAFQDITERKQAERLLADYNRTLEQQVIERTLLLSQEIEERQRFENALRQSEEQRRLTMDFTNIGSWNWNILENTTEWNDNHARLLGLVPGEVESSYQVWRDRVHPNDIHRVEQAVTVALATHTDFEAEYRAIYPDGSIHWLVGRGRGIYNAAGQPVQMLGVILDISDRKRAEQASILEERNRMAREIHDTLAQAFTGILVHMGTVARLVTTNPKAIPTHINTVRELARSGLVEARRSVAALRPQLLETGNLWTALEQFVSLMKSSTETSLICEIVGTPYTLSSETENNLLKIGQEAFTNAIKYAHANEIRIELVYEPTRCILRIRDNGRGFEVNDTILSQGFGLLGMSERAEQIEAQLSIESQLEQGTKVVVCVNRETAT